MTTLSTSANTTGTAPLSRSFALCLPADTPGKPKQRGSCWRESSSKDMQRALGPDCEVRARVRAMRAENLVQAVSASRSGQQAPAGHGLKWETM